jgi:uncharacterized protein
MSWITTNSGKQLDFLQPDPDTILIQDIATGLSNMPRWAGQITTFYSVAEHSLLMESLARVRFGNLDKELSKAILLHDATEAYMCDIPTPLKQLIPDYQEIETRLAVTIMAKFNISEDPEIWDKVTKMDAFMLKNEAIQRGGNLNWLSAEKYKDVEIMDGFRLFHFKPEQVRDLFLKAWEVLQ